MKTQTILIGAAVVVGGVLLYRQLKPGFSPPPASASGPQYAVPSPTAPPKSEQSTLDRVLSGVQTGTQLVKVGEDLFGQIKSIWS